MKIRMESVMPQLEKDYYGFIEGLKDEIRPMVRMLNPQILHMTLRLLDSKSNY